MTESLRAPDEAATQFMIVDFLAEILKFSDRPDQMGQFLARQLRELMGVRAVLMVQESVPGQEAGLRVVAVEPRAAANPVVLQGLARILELQRANQGAGFTLRASASPALAGVMDELRLTSLSTTPLRVGDARVGTLVGLDHLDFRRPDELARLLDALSPVFALILRNTIHFESQEAKVLAQAANYQALLRTNLDGYVVVNAEGGIVEANEAYVAMSGFSLSELKGKSVAELEAVETVEETRERTRRAQAAGSDRFQSRHRRKDGSSFPVEVSITYVPSEGRIIALVRDLTERVAAETALRDSEAHHRELLEMLGEGIAIVDPEETFIMANREMERILGLGAGALVGLNLRPFLEDGEWTRIRSFSGRRRQGLSDSYEMRIRRRDGEARVLQITVTPRFDAQGGFTGSLAVARDLTDTLKTQEALRLAQKMESLGSLAGGVAHDMNNVLGAIMALASVHHLQAAEASPLQRNMETIVKACQRGGTLVKGLLGFARQGLAEERNLDLNELVREQAALLERTTLQKVALDVRLAPELRPVLGDPAALSHALMNLCVNGVDAMAAGGTLTLRTWNGPQGTVCLEVADTGCGMGEEVLRKAMDPFFTTKPQGKGTGLGLALAYSTVKAHHGHLEIQSRVDQGTRILLSFPVAGGEAGVAADGPGAQAAAPGQPLTVLLVDDDELVRAATAAVLETLGHRVVPVPGGEQALGALEAGLVPDLVVLDMNMPGLDGAGVLPPLRALCPRVPVLLATGRVDQKALDCLDRYQGVALLPKPFALDELRERMAGLKGWAPALP